LNKNNALNQYKSNNTLDYLYLMTMYKKIIVVLNG